MCECILSSALRSAGIGTGGAPLCLSVTLTTSDEVQQLRSKVASLQRDLDAARIDFNRVEYRYRCEVLLNLQLQDLMRAAGVPFPRRLCTKGTVPDDFKGYV